MLRTSSARLHLLRLPAPSTRETIAVAPRLLLPLPTEQDPTRFPSDTAVEAGERLLAPTDTETLPLLAPRAGRLAGTVDANHRDGTRGRFLVLLPSDDAPPPPNPDDLALTRPPAVLRSRIAEAAIAVPTQRTARPLATLLDELVSATPRFGRHLVVRLADVDPFVPLHAALARGLDGHLADLLFGIEALCRASGCETRHLAHVGDNLPAKLDALADEHRLTLHRLPAHRYPALADPLLAARVLGRELDLARGPVHTAGVLVLDLVTVLEVTAALRDGAPATEEDLVVVSPRGCRLVRAPRGTPLATLVGDDPAAATATRLVLGGPMTGTAIPDLDTPLPPAARSLHLFGAQDVTPYANQPCVGCGRCVDVCPAHLLPGLLSREAEFGQLVAAREHHLDSCFACGSCAHVCPAGRALTQLFAHARAGLARKEIVS